MGYLQEAVNLALAFTPRQHPLPFLAVRVERPRGRDDGYLAFQCRAQHLLPLPPFHAMVNTVGAGFVFPMSNAETGQVPIPVPHFR